MPCADAYVSTRCAVVGHALQAALKHFRQTFNKLQINLDDTEDADVLSHLVTAIQFIEAEMEKGRGVLVHCQAGLSE